MRKAGECDLVELANVERFAKGNPTAPAAGYCRASAMWSEDSFAGRVSSALRNDLQNITSVMVGCCCRVWDTWTSRGVVARCRVTANVRTSDGFVYGSY